MFCKLLPFWLLGLQILYLMWLVESQFPNRGLNLHLRLSFGFMISFTVQKLLSLIRSNLFILFLFSLLQELGHRRSCFDLCHPVFCLCFPLRVLQFLVLHLGLPCWLTFRSLIHFEFIFVYGVRKRSKFHSFTHSSPVFPAPFIEEAVLNTPLYILASFAKKEVPTGAWIYFWAFYLVPLVYISVFVPVPYCLDDCSFVV